MFKVFEGAVLYATSLVMQHSFKFTNAGGNMVGQAQFKALPLAFPTIIFLTPCLRNQCGDFVNY